MGDCILALPALEYLKTEYTEVWTRGDVVPLIRFADRVLSIASTGLDLLELDARELRGALVKRLRTFDSIVSWYGSNRAEFRDCVRSLGLPFEFLSALPSESDRMHAADFFLRQVGGRGLAIPRIACRPSQPGDYAAIHPFSGSAGKNWSLDLYRETAQRLQMPVQWCAGPEESLDDAVRMDNLWDLAHWLAAARLYIGNDSGITHLAAAVGTPVIAIFGPTDPAIWAPRGDDVRIIHAPLQSTGVDQVLDVARRLRASALLPRQGTTSAR